MRGFDHEKLLAFDQGVPITNSVRDGGSDCVSRAPQTVRDSLWNLNFGVKAFLVWYLGKEHFVGVGRHKKFSFCPNLGIGYAGIQADVEKIFLVICRKLS
ncbi:MAG TPA: hypothetical protein VMF90_15825 [Rhizobiaceae bacterium]|nr:hypothetical protein [Rhizobiaceae bacterium]